MRPSDFFTDKHGISVSSDTCGNALPRPCIVSEAGVQGMPGAEKTAIIINYGRKGVSAWNRDILTGS